MKSILLLLSVMMIAGVAATQHGHYDTPPGRQPKPITVRGVDRAPVAAGHLPDSVREPSARPLPHPSPTPWSHPPGSHHQN